MKRVMVVFVSLALCLSCASIVSAAPLPANGWIELTVFKIEKANPLEAREDAFTFHFFQGTVEEDKNFELTTHDNFYIELFSLAFKLHKKVYLNTKNSDLVGAALIQWPPTDD